MKLSVAIIAAVMALSVIGFKLTPTSFLPEEDQGIVFADIQLPDTASINRTTAILAQMNQEILPLEGVKYFISVAGYSMLGGGGENVALGVVGLENWDKRRQKTLSSTAIINRLREHFAPLKEAKINFFA